MSDASSVPQIEVLPPEKKKRGRATTFTPELGERICKRLAEGESLRGICKDADMPAACQVHQWLLLTSDPMFDAFRTQYDTAKKIQAHNLVDEILDISDDGNNDWMERLGPEGQSLGWQLNGEHVQRSKLRVDSRKWFAGKVFPKLYGERLITQDETPRPNLPYKMGQLTLEELGALVELLDAAKAEPSVIGQATVVPPPSPKKKAKPKKKRA